MVTYKIIISYMLCLDLTVLTFKHDKYEKKANEQVNAKQKKDF